MEDNSVCNVTRLETLLSFGGLFLRDTEGSLLRTQLERNNNRVWMSGYWCTCALMDGLEKVVFFYGLSENVCVCVSSPKGGIIFVSVLYTTMLSCIWGVIIYPSPAQIGFGTELVECEWTLSCRRSPVNEPLPCQAGSLKWISGAEIGMDSCLCAKWPLALANTPIITEHKTGAGFPSASLTLKL